MNYANIIYTKEVILITEYIQFSVTLSFIVLGLFVLLYYIRRRYGLHKEIRAVTCEQMWQPNYQNHMKNLKIMAMITNFTLITLIIELGNNLLEFIIATIYTLKGIFYPIIFHFALILQSFYIPILCLLLKVLWLAYLHSQYKYTIMRWTVYITLRLVAIYIVHSWQFVYVSNNDIKVNISLLIFTYLHSVFQTIDLFTYILYSRRFYLHLKSREIEAKLFDEDKYLQSKYVRVHFKIATFIVTIALSLYTLSEGIFCLFSLSINISKFVNEVFIFSEWEYYLQSLLISRYALLSAYRILLDVNYMYVFLVIMFKYCRQKHQLTRINDRIHPYVREYQDQVFTRYL